MNNIASSATRVVLVMLVSALILINLYGMMLFEDDKFLVVFTFFKDVTLMVCGAFFMKSTSDAQAKKEEPKEDPLLSELNKQI
jgi:hypothetical protein